MELNSKEINALLIRVALTFVQGFSAVWAATGFKLDKGTLGGAVAAGISVVYNLVVKPYLENLKNVSGA